MVNERGQIVPSIQDVNLAVNRLLTDLSSNDEVNIKFRANPGGYIQNMGIPSDGVPELMRELGLQAESITIQICTWTCFWTNGCAWTGSAQAISLHASVQPVG